MMARMSPAMAAVVALVPADVARVPGECAGR